MWIFIIPGGTAIPSFEVLVALKTIKRIDSFRQRHCLASVSYRVVQDRV
jgi:hypothetical protein